MSFIKYSTHGYTWAYLRTEWNSAPKTKSMNKIRGLNFETHEPKHPDAENWPSISGTHELSVQLMYICMYVCIYVCIYVYISSYMYMGTGVQRCAYVCTLSFLIQRARAIPAWVPYLFPTAKMCRQAAREPLIHQVCSQNQRLGRQSNTWAQRLATERWTYHRLPPCCVGPKKCVRHTAHHCCQSRSVFLTNHAWMPTFVVSTKANSTKMFVLSSTGQHRARKSWQGSPVQPSPYRGPVVYLFSDGAPGGCYEESLVNWTRRKV